MSIIIRMFCYNKRIMFGEKLKELRTENKMTQGALAAQLKCSQSMIARWEKSECEPTESTIRSVAILFNGSADYLLGVKEDA